MKIQLSQPDLLGGPENMVTELKTSIFIAPDENIPGTKQYFQIAKTIAGFINAEGGTLWLGVADDGIAKGVEADLAILGGGSARSCRGPWSNDEGMSFGGTADQYILKLKELVKALLGPSAEKYIAGAQAAKVNGRIVVKVPVSKADVGYVAYVYKWLSRENKYSEELYQRVANGTSHLEGFARDKFIRDKCREEFSRQLAALEVRASGLTKGELVAALRAATNEVRSGVKVTVIGAVAITDVAIKDMNIKGFVFDGEHVKDVKSVAEFVEEMLKKIQSVNPAVFDVLPETKGFASWFSRVQPGRRTPKGHYRTPFGTAGDIRAKEQSNKTYIANSNYYLQKLIVLSGIPAEKFMARGK